MLCSDRQSILTARCSQLSQLAAPAAVLYRGQTPVVGLPTSSPPYGTGVRPRALDYPPCSHGDRTHYRGNMLCMALAHSKLTAQGQISVPAKIRKKLGVGPGSVLEWDDDGEQVVVRRAGRFSSEEIHRSLFPTPPRPKTLEDLKAGVRQHMKRRRAGR